MTKIIMLNGPSRCGKDYAAAVIARTLEEDDVIHLKLSAPLKAIASMLTGIPTETMEITKDAVIPVYGCSYRDIQINLFQAIARVFGEEWLGTIMVNQIKQADESVIVISDGGRTVEVNPLIKAFGAKNIAIFQIIRDGCDFNHDIREYINNPRLKRYILYNDGSHDFDVRLLNAMWNFINGEAA